MVAMKGQRLTNGTIKDNQGINAKDCVDFVRWLEQFGPQKSAVEIRAKLQRIKLERYCSYIMEHPDMKPKYVHPSKCILSS